MIKSILLMVLILPTEVASGGPFSLERDVVLPAGDTQGGDFSMNGVAGQTVVGTISGGRLTLHAGFHTPLGIDGPPQEAVFSDGFE